MGASPPDLMMKTILLLGFALAITSALPSGEESVVPEDALFQQDADFAATKAELEQMRAAGKSDKDCRKLADATEDDVRANVKGDQSIVDKMDKGEQCPSKGQDAVKLAKKNLDSAKTNKSNKDSALAKAQKKKINFGDFVFDSLTPGQCSTFFNMAVYKNAANAVATAKKQAEQAAGALKNAEKDHKDAVAAAAEAVRKCQCAVKKKHKDTVKKLNDAAEAANKKAWKKAADLRCLLDGTPPAKCKVTAIPTVKPVKLLAATEAAKCGPTDYVVFNSFGGNAKSCGTGCVMKTGGGNSWNADAVSLGAGQQMKNGGAGFCAQRSGTWPHSMIGLDHKDSSNSYTDIDFAMYADSSYSFRVYETGSYKWGGAHNTWKNGNYGCVWVTDNNKVEYYSQDANNKIKHWYTSSKTPTYPLHVDAGFWSSNARFQHIYWISTPPTVGSSSPPNAA